MYSTSPKSHDHHMILRRPTDLKGLCTLAYRTTVLVRKPPDRQTRPEYRSTILLSTDVVSVCVSVTCTCTSNVETRYNPSMVLLVLRNDFTCYEILILGN